MTGRNLMNRRGYGNRGYGFGRTFDDIFDLIGDASRDFGLADISDNTLNVTTDEDENNYYVKAEMPGINEEDVDVSVEDGMLSISADYKEEGENMLRQGKYSWACRVEDADHDNIDAKLKDGILNITLPKSEKLKPRKIEINK